MDTGREGIVQQEYKRWREENEKRYITGKSDLYTERRRKKKCFMDKQKCKKSTHITGIYSRVTSIKKSKIIIKARLKLVKTMTY